VVILGIRIGKSRYYRIDKDNTEEENPSSHMHRGIGSLF
jgi:hypothetical protein